MSGSSIFRFHGFWKWWCRYVSSNVPCSSRGIKSLGTSTADKSWRWHLCCPCSAIYWNSFKHSYPTYLQHTQVSTSVSKISWIFELTKLLKSFILNVSSQMIYLKVGTFLLSHPISAVFVPLYLLPLKQLCLWHFSTLVCSSRTKYINYMEI